MTGLSARAVRSYQFDVRQFRRMVAVGIFGDQKVELVAGRIYEMTELSPHTFAVETLHEQFGSMLPREHWTIREEKPVVIGRFWAPKPDISVLRGNRAACAARMPRHRDVALLAEVSDATSHRERKWRRYAAAGIPVSIIVRLKGADTIVEVWNGPTGRGALALYADVVRYRARAGVSVPIEIDGNTHGQIAVADLVARHP
jgi:Uma2 family endonuclease